MDVIRLENMQFYGYHGVSEMERELGGKFEVDLEMFFPLKKAGNSDRIEDTLDYEAAYKLVQSCVVRKKYFLLEALAETIIDTCMKTFSVHRIVVRVRKPNAPIKGVLEHVEIECDRSRSEDG
ncbi:MAG: dihydroneopterin aldolase [Candidatus Marinimicrobia bacterium]|jgi:dihydroneopterin aldolase|nr:dihydroneopterin aldolase [Candidatus Neomarinimicrobiota bacterium]